MPKPQIGLYIPVKSFAGGGAKLLQKTICIQAYIIMKTSQVHACYQTREMNVVVQ